MRQLRHVLAVALFLIPSLARAGNGNITAGRINVTLNFRFPPTAPQLATTRDRITAMSHLLYDATEGRLSVGTVTMRCSNVNSDLADYWMFAEPVRSNSPVDALSTTGAHINQFFADSGPVWAHEFGHLGLGLWDEYAENETGCNGQGWCIEESPAAFDEINQCLMQQSPGVSWSEFCVDGNHDSLRGNNTTPCVLAPAAGGAPCADNCASWNTTTLRYEDTRQQQIAGVSCWQALSTKFGFPMPAATPVAAEPAGWIAPTFTEVCGATNTLLLVLDASGSMGWHPDNDNGEVCGNGLDDDGDGAIDETADCADPRIRYLRAAGRSVLELANGSGVRAGIISFDDTPTLREALQDIPANIGVLTASVNGINPGGNTAIGSALQFAKTRFDLDAAPNANKAAVIITDGQNTAGPAPDVAVPDYVAAGIRVYGISTGSASNTPTITSISSNTRGHHVNEPASRSLVTAVAELWSLYTNGGIVVPKSPYAINRNNQGATPIDKNDAAAQTFAFVRPTALPASQFVEFDVERETEQVTALLAGNLNEMAGFGVRSTVRRPDGTTFDSDAPPAGVRIVYDRDFTFIRITSPMPGRWRLNVFARPGAAPVQTGNLIVLSENPLTNLFADLDRYTVNNPAQPLRLTLLPSFFTGLRDVAWDVRVRQPNGAVVPVTVTPDPGKPEYYHATIAGFPNAGMYEIDITMRTTTATTNDPGEPRPGTNPPNTIPIPPIERHLTRSFFVTSGPWFCQGDCDGDGFVNEPTTGDPNGNGIPPSHDSTEGPNGVHNPDAPRPADGPGLTSRRGFWYGFAVGSSHPLGSLDKIADANIYAKVDLERELAPLLRARLTLGLAQFTAQPALSIDHPRFTHLSLNLHRLFPRPSGVHAFAEIGPGLYRDESGTTDVGANLGAGFRLRLTSAADLEFGADYHFVNTDGTTHFLTWHLGVLFR